MKENEAYLMFMDKLAKQRMANGVETPLEVMQSQVFGLEAMDERVEINEVIEFIEQNIELTSVQILAIVRAWAEGMK